MILKTVEEEVKHETAILIVIWKIKHGRSGESP